MRQPSSFTFITPAFSFHRNPPTQTKPHPLLLAANLLKPANAIANTQPPLISHKPHGIWAKEACTLLSQSLTRKTAEPARAKVTLDHTIRICINTVSEEDRNRVRGPRIHSF